MAAADGPTERDDGTHEYWIQVGIEGDWQRTILKLIRFSRLKGHWREFGQYLNYVKNHRRAERQGTFNEMRDAAQQDRQDIHDPRQQKAAPQRQADQAGEPEIIRRLGEPQAFKNEESKFSEWLQELNSNVPSVFGANFRPVIERAVDQANDTVTPTTAAAVEQLVNEAEDGEAVDKVDEKLSQLYAVFFSLTEGESFGLVVSAGQGNADEALRLLVRRWGPSSGGRRRALLKKITAPARAAKWEVLVRRHERRRADGRDAHLDDEIKMSALESLAPQDVEMHLALSRTRLQDYTSMREEVRGSLETRQAQGALGRSRGDPTEVDAFGQRFQQQGVRRGYLNNFEGDTQSTISTQRPASASQAGVCNQSPAALSFDAFERVLELNSVEVKDEKQYRKCITMTFDTGAAATAFPLAATAFPLEQEGEYTEADGSSHRAATGEIVEDEGGVGIKGVSEHGESMFLKDRRANIGKPLLSASATAAKGHFTRVNAFGGYILKESEFTQKIHQMIDQCVAEGNEGIVTLHLQNGVYKMDVLMDQPAGATSSGSASRGPSVAGNGPAGGASASEPPDRLQYEKGSETAKTMTAILRRLHQRKCSDESDYLLELKSINTRLQVTPHFEIGVKFVVQLEGLANLMSYKLKLAKEDEGQEDNFPMLVARDSKTKLPSSTAIPGKKVTNFMINIPMSFILHLGYRRLIFLSDGEPAIAALKTAVAVATPTVEFLPRESPAGEHQSNGGIEVTAREVKRQVRANRYAPEAKLGRKVDDDHPILKRLPQYAAACIGRYRRGTDGLTGEQRRSGRDWRKLEAEFGERVMHGPLAPGGRRSTMEERAMSGNFLGYHMRDVLRRDIEKYGATAGCPGCLVLTQKGKITKSHSDERRNRIAVFEVKKQLEETKLPYRRPLGTAIELLPQSRGAPRWRRCRLEAVPANRALPGSAEETHPNLDELPGHEAMREEAQHLQLLKLGSRSSERRAPDGSMDVDSLERINGYDKGHTFVMIYELAVFQMRTNANVNDAEQAEEIAPLLTEMCAVDTAEVYSPRRFAEMTFRYGLTYGLAVDIDTGWDLRLPEQRKECKKQLKDEDPLLTITNPRIVEAEILEGETHLDFSREICKERHKAGKLFLHEAPWSASSWYRPSVQEVMQLAGVFLVHGPMCRWHMQATDSNGKLGFVRKETGWLTNSELLAEILKGPHPHEEDTEVFAEYQDDYFIDDLTGDILDSEGAQAAWQEELDWCRGRQVWKKVPRREMLENGKKAVTLKWIDTNKGDRGQPRYRSRLVARKIRKAMRSEDRPDQAELFSAMPPLEAFKAMVAIFVGRVNDAYHDGDTEEIIYKFYDISRAHFYGDVNREVYVELPEEETNDDPEPMAGRLLKTMHGTVDASHVWQDDHIGLTSSHGLKKGASNPALLHHAERHIQAEVHDDFGVIMRKSQEQSVVYLNRVLIWNPFERLAYLEADTRHVKKVIRDLGLENAKEVTTLVVKWSVAEIQSSNQTSPKLDDEKMKTYRSVTMRIMHLSLDRPEISYSASTQARRTKEPKETHMEDSKRIGRYLKKHPAGRSLFPAQRLPRKVGVYCDSDYAGDPITRRPRSGMAILWGAHLLKHGSTVQSTVSLSSGEAEYYALLRGACHGFGAQATLADLGVEVDYEMELYIFSDSSAARGIASRQGLGAVRHLDVRFLWLQERIQSKRPWLKTADGHWNPADLFTKALDQDTMERLMKLICFTMKFDGSVRHRALRCMTPVVCRRTSREK
ncbi:unnamed protein product [Prorocentrum cordatum]|uniref:Uncharacterized protein n=1 Tax=Prorocentrum cordatum TaxID=2364126 RepID=A0ABN9TBV2_9DINO|nr:unnamed protein product [Polarella glacialis]